MYLIRHGRVIHFLAGAYNGHNDVDLSDVGVRQMEAVAERLRYEPVTGVYCSDLIRTGKGAEIIGRDHNIVPIADADFREMNFGLWEGLTFTEISEQFPDELRKWNESWIDHAPPGGENLADLKERVLPAVRRIVACHHGRVIVLVAHGGVNRVILADAMSISLKDIYSMEQNYGCINIIDYYPDRAVVTLMNGGTNDR
jgi:alpha-ribazole phosphatase/probable phosphoglycerate mutase